MSPLFDTITFWDHSFFYTITFFLPFQPCLNYKSLLFQFNAPVNQHTLLILLHYSTRDSFTIWAETSIKQLESLNFMQQFSLKILDCRSNFACLNHRKPCLESLKFSKSKTVSLRHWKRLGERTVERVEPIAAALSRVSVQHGHALFNVAAAVIMYNFCKVRDLPFRLRNKLDRAR